MQTEPGVITGNTELINSTNIERIVTGRNVALVQIEQLIQQLSAISQLTTGIGGGNASDWAMKQGHRYDCWLMEKPETAIPVITRNIDRSLWRDLMLKSGMLSLMDDRPELSGIRTSKVAIYRLLAKLTSSAHLNSCTKAKRKYLNAA